MHVIASQKFQIPGQQVGRSDGQARHSDASRDELVIGRFAPAPVSNQDDGYYWTDEGYEHLRSGQYDRDHAIPHFVLTNDLRSSDGFLEAVSEKSLLVGALICCIVIGAIGLAGAVGLERAERAAVQQGRV
jgi:hypothetical protein